MSHTPISNKLLIWDSDLEPPTGDWVVVLWKSYRHDLVSSVISIPERVESQADQLKEQFLAWIYELGEAQINKKRLIDHLELRPGFSYWWMTLLAEKNYGKSSRLYDAIRLFALERLIQERVLQQISFYSHDKNVASSLKKLCLHHGICFKWQRTVLHSTDQFSARAFYYSLPYTMQALFSLVKNSLERWPFRSRPNSFNSSINAEITFVDYMLNLDRTAVETGRFGSNYWTKLIPLFSDQKVKVNWVHHYLPNEAVPSRQKAQDLLARFNLDVAGLERHECLDGAISFSLICSTLQDYLLIVWRSLCLRKIKLHFRLSESNLDLWPLFKNDWYQSLRGPVAMNNCMIVNLFEKLMSQLPPQKTGVYLQENMPWEMAFIYAWRAAGHGHLIGVQHATVRYWDLRYFNDPRSYTRKNKHDFPMPDKVAVNGMVARDAHLKWSYPVKNLVDVEALRYLYLGAKRVKSDVGESSSHTTHVLVCGDIMPSLNHKMMTWLEIAANYLSLNISYTIKPHPACKIIPENYPSLSMQLTNASLFELLSDCDVVFTSNNTSAAVDAYGFGRPVIQVLDGSTFNTTPLRGIKGVVYVTSPIELANALGNIQQRDLANTESYFFLDAGLPRWRQLLNFGVAQDEQSVLL